MNTRSKILLTIILIIFLYAILLLFSDIEKIYDKLIDFKIEFLPIILVLSPLAWFLIYIRWYLLLQNLGIKIPHKNNFLIFLGSSALGITPGKVGELLKAQFFKEKFGIERTKTVPLIFVEKFYDVVSAVIISFFGIWYFQEAGYIIIGAIVSIIILSALISSQSIFNKAIHIFGKFSFTKKFLEPLSESYEYIRESLRWKIAVLSISLSIGYWLVISVTVYFVMLALNIDPLDFGVLIITYTASLILGAVSFLPGGIGVTEGTLVGLFSLQNIDISTAIVLVIFIRIFILWYSVIVGFISLKISRVFS
jgi:uncharacterized protein (TIRG00374 family)